MIRVILQPDTPYERKVSADLPEDLRECIVGCDPQSGLICVRIGPVSSCLFTVIVKILTGF